jgi:hypothetical protein
MVDTWLLSLESATVGWAPVEVRPGLLVDEWPETGQQHFCQPVLGQRRRVHPSTGEAVCQRGEAAQSPVRHLWINGLHFKSIATESTRPLSFFPMIMESIYILLFQNIKVFIW